MFVEAASSLDELTDTISAYVNFCTDISIPVKHLIVFANNKPWITKNVKEVINRKKCILGKGSAEESKGVNRELRRVIKQEKAKYKNTVEENVTENNMKPVGHGMKLMSGYSNGGQNPSKAAGPDKLSPRVLKLCSNQLVYIFSVLYNISFRNRSIPAIWKKTCIIPVPKKPVISCMNDRRPIALTSVPMNVCERLVLNDLKLKVAPHLDPMQFVYQTDRNTEDAILILLELLYSHLERTRFGNSARVMFFDFSSAFPSNRIS